MLGWIISESNSKTFLTEVAFIYHHDMKVKHQGLEDCGKNI